MNKEPIYLLPRWLMYHTDRRRLPYRFARSQKSRGKLALKRENSLQGFDKLKCIFFHIPKAAGVSLAFTLFGDLGGGHIPIYRQYYLKNSKRLVAEIYNKDVEIMGYSF